MEIRVEDQSLMEEAILFFQRLLYLDHHLALIPYIFCLIQNMSSRFLILFRGKTGSNSCVTFDIHLMTCSYVILHVVRCHTYSKFIVFDFFYATDSHACSPF